MFHKLFLKLHVLYIKHFAVLKHLENSR